MSKHHSGVAVQEVIEAIESELDNFHDRAGFLTYHMTRMDCAVSVAKMRLAIREEAIVRTRAIQSGRLVR